MARRWAAGGRAPDQSMAMKRANVGASRPGQSDRDRAGWGASPSSRSRKRDEADGRDLAVQVHQILMTPIPAGKNVVGG
jgi:hypothetical protein